MTSTPPHALITGAGSGIGLATARRALQRGWRVSAVDRDEAALRRELGSEDVHTITADLSDGSVHADVVAAAEAAYHQPPSVLVHCAGRYPIKAILDLSIEEWRQTIELNATGTLFMAKAVAERLVATGTPGSLVTLSSIAARSGDAHEPSVAYSSSKAAVEAITRQLAIEFGPHDIRVNSVAPGMIQTPMLRVMDNPEAAEAYIADALPLRRLGLPDEVAEVCLFLASPASSYVSGTTVVVDGGLTA